MPEEFSAFLMDLGPLDVLLCAGDFYGATAELDSASAFEKIFLEPILQRFFEPDTPDEGIARTAFLMSCANGKTVACIVERAFEMVSLPLNEMCLLPAGLSSGKPGRSILAVRFAGESRMQYLLDIKTMAEGGSAL